MNKDDVPQDNAKSFEGKRKAVYAVGNDGHYTVATSSGWEAEEVVLDLAIAQYDDLARDTLQRVQQGTASPLEYHMYRCRMDVTVLAQSTGYFKWRVRRHLKSNIFNRLNADKLTRYADALGMTCAELQHVPA